MRQMHDPRLRVPLLHCVGSDIQYFFGLFRVSERIRLRMVNCGALRDSLAPNRAVPGKDLNDAPDRSSRHLHAWLAVQRLPSRVHGIAMHGAAGPARRISSIFPTSIPM